MKEKLKQVLEKSFPGRYEIRDRSFILYYPSLELTTSSGTKHTLTDIYIRVSMYHENIGHLDVCRMSATPGELQCNYCHSHGGGLGLFEGVCLGSSGIAGSSIATEESIMLLLSKIKAYIQYQNSFDCPNPISNIRKSGAPISLGKIKVAETFIKAFMRDNAVKVRNHLVVDSKLNVIPKPSLERELGKLITVSKYKCFKQGSKYFKRRSDTTVLYRIPSHTIKFRGKEIKFKVLNSEKDESEEFEVARPEVTKEFCKKLSLALRRQRNSKKRTGAKAAKL